MMKRVVIPERETPSPSFGPQQQSRFAPRPFPTRQPVQDSSAGCCEPLFSYSLKDVSTYPREPVQPKLRLGPVGDKYEQEADRVARRVVEKISSPEQESLQRQDGEDEEELDLEELEEEEEVVAAQRQTVGAISSPDKGSVQRKDDEDEDELDLEELEEDAELRRKVTGVGPAGGADVGPALESAILGARGKGKPLSDRVRQPMERAFGADFGGVRVHTDGEADSLNRSIQARAFTTGQDIFLRQGEYRPGSSEGQRLLAHELTHVVQQSQGWGRPTGELDRLPLNNSRKLESEADSMGHKSLQTYSQIEKAKETKRRAVANYFDQEKKNTKQGFGLVDNQPVVASQKEIKNYINFNPRWIQLMKQPLITNWLGTTTGHTLEDNPPPKYIIENLIIEVVDGNIYARVKNLGEFAHLELYVDNDGGMWINHIEVKEIIQRRGVATKLVKKAIQLYGEIYASRSYKDIGGSGDTRHLSEKGAALVNGLIKKGVMEKDWLRDPVI